MARRLPVRDPHRSGILPQRSVVYMRAESGGGRGGVSTRGEEGGFVGEEVRNSHFYLFAEAKHLFAFDLDDGF